MTDVDANAFNDAPAAWDVSDVPDQMLPPNGIYDLEIISAKYKKSERTGRTGWNMRARILSEDSALQVCDPVGVSLWEAMPGDDAPKAFSMKRKIKEFLGACALGATFTPSEEGLKGLRFKGVVKQKPDQNGNPRAEVDRFVVPRP